MLTKIIKTFLRSKGFELIRYPSLRQRHVIKLLKSNNINLIFDVGANIGQYASEIFEIGYSGKIISFEPIEECYKKLSSKANENDNWIAENFAIGDKDGKINLNISKNTESSSILNMRDLHLSNAPDSIYFDRQNVEIFCLDSIYEKYIFHNCNIFLKIDTQGYEKHVISGASKLLTNAKGVQVEMSMVELYEEQILFGDLYKWMNMLGFELMYLSPSFVSQKTGEVLQYDGLFFKR